MLKKLEEIKDNAKFEIASVLIEKAGLFHNCASFQALAERAKNGDGKISNKDVMVALSDVLREHRADMIHVFAMLTAGENGETGVPDKDYESSCTAATLVRDFNALLNDGDALSVFI